VRSSSAKKKKEHSLNQAEKEKGTFIFKKKKHDISLNESNIHKMKVIHKNTMKIK